MLISRGPATNTNALLTTEHTANSVELTQSPFVWLIIGIREEMSLPKVNKHTDYSRVLQRYRLASARLTSMEQTRAFLQNHQFSRIKSVQKLISLDQCGGQVNYCLRVASRQSVTGDASREEGEPDQWSCVD